MTIVKRNWELFTILGVFWVILVYFIAQSLIINQGHLIYILDDVYIHMAIAKNFVQEGVWGINSSGFYRVNRF